MSEDTKKLSFLSKLDNILQDNYINNEVVRYDFGLVDTVILNNVVHNISSDEHVSFVLHLDELIVDSTFGNEVFISGILPKQIESNTNTFLKNEEYLINKIYKSNKCIKQLLLDQSIIAGLGNIYADEVLFASNISLSYDFFLSLLGVNDLKS